jgi:hypothetical protein
VLVQETVADWRSAATVRELFTPGTTILTLGLAFRSATRPHWNGDVLSGTNYDGGPFTATLKVGPDGVPLGADCLTFYAKPGGLPTNEIRMNVKFEYKTRFPGWNLPTTINLPGNKMEVLAVELSPESASPWTFKAARFLSRPSHILGVASQQEGRAKLKRFDPRKDGYIKIAGWYIKLSSLRTSFFLTILGATLALALAVAAASRRMTIPGRQRKAPRP